MSDTVPLSSPNALPDLDALNAFVTRNPELKRLEDILSQFNLFEAVGIVRHELRHSNLLAFLLDPGQTHGLGDAFLRQFLQEVSPDDFDGWRFETVDVRREWRNIDILLLDDSRRFALLIENKIDTGEHSGQLQKYYESVQSEWPDYDLHALYLTPGGDEPSHPDYLAVDYGTVCRAIETVAQTQPSHLDAGVHLLLTHYAQMLRRHIMTDTEVADLCRSIYAKHRRALDLIYEHKPDRRSEISDIALRLLASDPGWIYDGQRGTTWANCRPVEWKNNRFLGQLFCQLLFSESELTFAINIWNGSGNSLEDRSRLWDMARRFGWPVKKLRSGNNQTDLYRSTIFKISPSDSDDAVDLEAGIQSGWFNFVERQYPPLREALSMEEWLWDESARLPPLPVSRFGIGEFVKRLIDANSDLKRYNDGKWFVNFGLREWDVPGNYRWGHENGFWLVHFNFVNGLDSLTICLGVERGDETDRNTLLQTVQGHGFTGTRSKLQRGWSTLTSFPVLSAGDYGKTQEEAEALISERWATYLRDELPRIARAIRDEE